MSIDLNSKLQIKATMKFIEPPIWRRFTIPARKTLEELHDAIQVMFSWDDYHLRQFTIGRKKYGLPDPDELFEIIDLDDSQFELHQVIQKEEQKFKYVYDFGDNWEIDLKVEKILESSPREKYAICLEGKRNAPPEDVGGAPGYEEFLQAISDPTNDMHDELLEWIGGEFDPEAFDLQTINELLKELG